MPFPNVVREEALVRSGRSCCVCHRFVGRCAVVHHIVQEAHGGPNTLENAIVLCPHCHAEAGHYNPRHPLGTKYHPQELRRHRDDWWRYKEREYLPQARPPDYKEPPGSGRGLPVHRRPVGVLWSRRADISAAQEIVEFEARLLAKGQHENQARVAWYELYQRGEGEFFVYQESNHRGDWASAVVHGAPCFDQPGRPLTLDELQDQFPHLAAAAGLARVRRV